MFRPCFGITSNRRVNVNKADVDAWKNAQHFRKNWQLIVRSAWQAVPLLLSSVQSINLFVVLNIALRIIKHGQHSICFNRTWMNQCGDRQLVWRQISRATSTITFTRLRNKLMFVDVVDVRSCAEVSCSCTLWHRWPDANTWITRIRSTYVPDSIARCAQFSTNTKCNYTKWNTTHRSWWLIHINSLIHLSRNGEAMCFFDLYTRGTPTRHSQ